MNLSPSIFRVALAPLVGILLALPAAAHGADRYAENGAVGDCSTPALACDLTDALAAANSGDRILLAPGIHAPTGGVQDRAGVSGVTIMPTPGDGRPVLDLSSGTLRLEHGTSLTGVDVVATANRAIYAAGGMLDELRIVVTGQYAAGVELGDGAILRNSTVITSGTESAAVSVTASGAPAELRGATLLASGTQASALQVAPDYPANAAKVRAVNSIIRRTGNALEVRASAFGDQVATVELDHVASDPNAQLADGPGSSITSADGTTASPLFIDRPNGDLRQLAVSPTIDAGTSDLDGDGDSDAADAVAAGVHDLDGSNRQLGAPDLGADEREMPPLVLNIAPAFMNTAATVKLTVQPRGLASDIAADWGWGEMGWITTTASQATGNEPVEVILSLGAVPAGAKVLRIKARVSNSAGTLLTSSSVFEVPEEAMPHVQVDIDGDDTTTAAAAAPVLGPAATDRAESPVPVVLPGARPSLVATSAFQSRGSFSFRLRCRHSVSCRGTVLLTRLGAVRTASFKIPPGATRTVRLSLTSAQAARVRKAAKRGLRGLLEVRSLDDGSTWTAVRLFSAHAR